MIEPMTPDEAQEEAIQEILRPESDGGFACAIDLGGGKTLVGVEVAKRMGANLTLVVGPLSTLGHEDEEGGEGWAGTFARQRYGSLREIHNRNNQGRKALADLQWQVPGSYFIGQEYFTTLAWKKEQIFLAKKDANGNKVPRLDKKKRPMYRSVSTGMWENIYFDLFIFDESHRAQSVESMTNKALMLIRASLKGGMSGTYTGNSFDGAYGATRWIWPHRAEKNIYDWRKKWAEVTYDHFAVRNEKVVGELKPGAYMNSLPCYIRIESILHHTVELRSQKIMCDLYPEQRLAYDQLDHKMVAWIKDSDGRDEDHPLVTKFPITKRVRQRQVTLAYPDIENLIDDEGEMKSEVSFALDARSSKIDRLHKLIKDEIHDEPTLIFTDSRLFADVLTWRLNQKYGEGSARAWTGGMTKAVKAQNKADFIAGKFQFFVGVIAAMGTGTDGLQKICRNMVYMSSSDDGVSNTQSKGRIYRRGQFSDTVRVWWILARNTIDEGQLSSQAKEALANNVRLKKKKQEEARIARNMERQRAS